MKKLQHQPLSIRKMSTEMVNLAEETIIDYVTCPQCFDYIQPPSACCENGHFVCHGCHRENNKCPTCQTTNYPNKNNAVFNMLLKEIYFPCQYQENGCSGYFRCDELRRHHSECQFQWTWCRFRGSGCTAFMRPDQKAEHEGRCEYGVSCRINNTNGHVKKECTWRGDRQELTRHVMESHEYAWTPLEMESNVAMSCVLPIYLNFEKTELMHLRDLNEMFYFYSKSVENSRHYVAVQYIGNSDRAKEFKYSVEFMYDSKTVRYEDAVLPYNLTKDEVFTSNNCFYVDYDFLKKHFLAERMIDCYIKVYKKERTDMKGYLYLEN